MIEIRKVSGTQLDGVSLYLVFCNGMVSVKKVYAATKKKRKKKLRRAQKIVKFQRKRGKVESKMANR